MKYKQLGILWIAALFLIGMPAANALTLGFANTPAGVITFDGDNDKFYFQPSASASFTITSSDGAGGAVIGMGGAISGDFFVGPITISGLTETANVSSTGATLTIFDGVTNFTADITFAEIKTEGSAGGIHTLTANANVTNMSYSGSVADLVTLAAAPAGRSDITFNLGAFISLTELMADGALTDTASFSGSLKAVPIPAAVWLFGSALMGATVIARRKKSLPKEMAA